MVEVWLGLLLGGFTLEQRGDFYHNQNVWVKSSETSAIFNGIVQHSEVGGNSLPTSDFRLPTSDFRLPTSDFRLPT